MSRVLNPRAQLTTPFLAPFFSKPQYAHKSPLHRQSVANPSTRYSRQLSTAPMLTLPSTTANARRNRAPTRPTRLIVVMGYGCDVFSNHVKSQLLLLRRISRERKKFTNVDVLCNEKRSKSMTVNIARRLAAHPNALRASQFVNDVANKVDVSLSRGEHVTLIGHSYGGSVVSRVVMELKNAYRGAKVPNFKAITFGSIYIPKPEKTQGVNIKHYVYDNDIAAVCHKRSRTSCPFVTFLKPTRGYGAVKAHMDYAKYILAIAFTGSTNLNRLN